MYLPGSVGRRLEHIACDQARHQLDRLGAALDQRPHDLAARVNSHHCARAAALALGIERHAHVEFSLLPRLGGGVRTIGDPRGPAAPIASSNAAHETAKRTSAAAVQPAIDLWIRGCRAASRRPREFESEKLECRSAAPRVCAARARSACIFLAPMAHANASPGNAMSRSTVSRTAASSIGNFDCRYSIACRRLQPCECKPVSMTSPAAHSSSAINAANFDSVSRYSPSSSPSEAAYRPQPSTNAGSPPNLRKLGNSARSCCIAS